MFLLCFFSLFTQTKKTVVFDLVDFPALDIARIVLPRIVKQLQLLHHRPKHGLAVQKPHNSNERALSRLPILHGRSVAPPHVAANGFLAKCSQYPHRVCVRVVHNPGPSQMRRPDAATTSEPAPCTYRRYIRPRVWHWRCLLPWIYFRPRHSWSSTTGP